MYLAVESPIYIQQYKCPAMAGRNGAIKIYCRAKKNSTAKFRLNRNIKLEAFK